MQSPNFSPNYYHAESLVPGERCDITMKYPSTQPIDGGHADKHGALHQTGFIIGIMKSFLY